MITVDSTKNSNYYFLRQEIRKVRAVIEKRNPHIRQAERED